MSGFNHSQIGNATNRHANQRASQGAARVSSVCQPKYLIRLQATSAAR